MDTKKNVPMISAASILPALLFTPAQFAAPIGEHNLATPVVSSTLRIVTMKAPIPAPNT